MFRILICLAVVTASTKFVGGCLQEISAGSPGYILNYRTSNNVGSLYQG